MAGKSADQWFGEYAESHQNATNKLIHWICVPLIAASVIAFCWSLPVPAFMQNLPYANWGTVLAALTMLFYVWLSPPLAVGMFGFSVIVIGAIWAWEGATAIPVWQPALAVFALAWIGQFVGHSIEGRKPSFFQDLQFLLIGPIWLLGFIYRRMGIRY